MYGPVSKLKPPPLVTADELLTISTPADVRANMPPDESDVIAHTNAEAGRESASVYGIAPTMVKAGECSVTFSTMGTASVGTVGGMGANITD